ncbi:hypothetical protein HPB47_023480 [Ixodes persulcatus]|uniref:Uncharacterized protein n=1 Tax=Ixodes persulcatus TaxID=34615 RepID=A0AC60Q6W3_IXOPE|nr:hypothetical protein HPB47_023480 [Ixodes persulcatus]
MIASVKDRVRVLYNEWLTSGSHSFTTSGRLKRAPLETLAGWAREALATTPSASAMVERSFKKCGIANALDGIEDDMLWSAESDKELSESDEE